MFSAPLGPNLNKTLKIPIYQARCTRKGPPKLKARQLVTPPQIDSKGRSRRARHFDRAALYAFVPVIAIIPVWLIAMTLLWLPIGWLTNIALWEMLFAYLATGSTLFIPSVQRRILTLLMGARKPTSGEAPKLQSAFNEVTQAWHLRDRNFAVGVVDDTELNAFASGGHLVIVTSFAITELNHDELCGVLAHELCHHLGSHTVALTIGQWLTLPVYFLARVGAFMRNVSHAATDTFARRSELARLLGRFIAAIFNAMSLFFNAGYSAIRFLGNMVGRSAEFHADQRVVRMGYGRQLAAALKRTIVSGMRSTSHPPARTRIARIEAALRPDRKGHPSTTRPKRQP